MTYTQHPLSAAYPAMDTEDYQALRDSIEDIGVQIPVVVYDGAILDGWHRYSAATEVGVECPIEHLPDGVDPVDFVRAANKVRRHLTKSQLALVEVTLRQWMPEGRRSNSAAAAELPGSAKSAQQMAETAGVSVRTIELAKEVQAKATPEVKAAVMAGKMSVEKAVATTKEPKEPRAAKKPEPEPADPESAPSDAAEQLEEMQADIDRLAALVKAAEADDAKAEVIKWRRLAEHAQRAQAEAMDNAARAKKREEWTARQLARCGKAVSESDPDKIAAAVEAFVRTYRPRAVA